MKTSMSSTIQSAPGGHSLTHAARRRSLAASTAGNILEWYEWSTYSVMAPFIAAQMFDGSNPASSLLSVFAVFAVGFLMRPIGGVLFGWIGDRFGRKLVLISTMLLMAAASFAIGATPSFATIGIGASLLLLLFRCIQGLAHGGESSASATYLGEIAPAAKRGQWGSVWGMSVIGGSILAFVISALLTSILGEKAMADYGWRIPFLLGGLMALVVLWMRRRMQESDVFEDQGASAVVEKLPRRKMVLITLRLIAFTAGLTSVNYVWMSYMTTYAVTNLGMDKGTAFWVTAAAQAVSLVALPFFGALSDRIGRKPMMFSFAALAFVTTIPLTLMVGNQPWSLGIAVALSLLIWALSQCIYPAIQSESFPTHIRGRGVGFAFSISVALFGGTAPYLNQLSVGMGAGWIFSLYIMALCAASFAATFFFRETKGIDLKNVSV